MSPILLNKILLNYISIPFKELETRFLLVLDGDSDPDGCLKYIKEKCSFLPQAGLPQAGNKKPVKGNVSSNDTENAVGIQLDLSQIKHNKIIGVKASSEKLVINKTILLGFYMLPGKDGNIGTLDYLTLPLMRASKKELFENIEAFVKANQSGDPNQTDFSDIKNQTAISKENVTDTAKYYKTLIGIAGQFHKKNVAQSNAVFYANGLYMGEELKNNAQCKEIVNLVTELLK